VTTLPDVLAKLDAYEQHLDSPKGGLASTSHWLQFAEAAAAFVRANRVELQGAREAESRLDAMRALATDLRRELARYRDESHGGGVYYSTLELLDRADHELGVQ
jgi:hypothetical protein